MSSIEDEHARAILHSLFANGSASRAVLADRLGLRKGTVGSVCGELLRAGALREAAAGRQRNVALEVVPSAFAVLGMEHLRDGLRYSVVEADRRPVLTESTALPEALTGAARLERIATTVGQLWKQAGRGRRLAAMGFCDIGMVDRATGCSIRAEVLPAWEGQPVGQRLHDAIGAPVHVLGRTNSWALSEMLQCGAASCGSFLYVLLDRQIGLAAFVHDHFLDGETGVFGELGHLVIDPDGAICLCGNRGCLETVAGTDAIVRKVRDHLPGGVDADLGAAGEALTIEQVIGAAQRGHRLAGLAIHEAALAVGTALAHAVSLLGLRRIVFGGPLADAGELLLAPVRSTLRQRVVAPLNGQIDADCTAANPFAGAHGAACYALREVFAGPGTSGWARRGSEP